MDSSCYFVCSDSALQLSNQKNKTMNMKKRMEIYTIFHNYLLASRRECKELPAFSEICIRLDLPQRELEDLIYEELGVSGEDIVSAYRN